MSRFKETLVLERIRAVSLGVLTTAQDTFILLIAVQWFHASPAEKAFIPASVSIGLFLSPVSLIFLRRYLRTPSQSAALIWGASSLGYFLAVISDSSHFFLIGAAFAMILQSAATPLTTQIYQQNYPERRRGRAFSQSASIKILTTVVCSYLFGLYMNQSIQDYHLLMLIYSIASVSSAWLLHRCIAERITDAHESTHILRGWHYVKADALFRNTLISWMILGFANLMTLPLRVEFLGNPRYGMALSPAEVALYVGVIPSASRLLLSPIWGYIFDHLNFIWTRVFINLCFAVGIFSFFVPNEPWALVLGSIAYGIGNAGGDIAWQLWVTKVAPANRVADYMAIHVFFTGLRGIIAPFLGFYLMNLWSPTSCAWVAVAMILGASALFLRERSNFSGRVQ